VIIIIVIFCMFRDLFISIINCSILSVQFVDVLFWSPRKEVG
jgi:hypothetical protein